MQTQLALLSLVVQCTATLFLFLVFLIVYRHSRQLYFAYWTAGWLCLGAGLLALLASWLGTGDARLLTLAHQASVGLAALLAFFARWAFLHGRRVPGRAWLLLVPACAWFGLVAAAFPPEALVARLPRHAALAAALWASGALFWRIARTQRTPGAMFLALSFALWGVEQAHWALGHPGLAGRLSHPEWVGFAETAVVILVALGMMVFALEEDRSRLRESTHKLEISEQQLKDLALRDPLTGLFNRRQFDDTAPQIEAQARRLDFAIGVFVIDLNHFKETNDRDGHTRGDQILRAFAEFLRRETRAADLTFRWGGDEFLLLMSALSRAHVEAKADQLRERWDAVRLELGIEVTLAIGWAFLEEDGLDAAIRRADRRMYGDKRAQHGAAALRPA